MKKIIKELKESIKDGRKYIKGLAQNEDFHGCRSVDDIIDKVMGQDNDLEFEVGYLKGVEYALSLISPSAESLAKVSEDIKIITDYTLENEEGHWEENDKPLDHVYTYAKNVENYLKSIK